MSSNKILCVDDFFFPEIPLSEKVPNDLLSEKYRCNYK